MPISTTAYYPTAFYRGWELGNGINDWIQVPKGNSPAIPRTTLWGNRAIMQIIGSNIYTNVMVNAFRVGADPDPVSFRVWWDLLIKNIWGDDPSLFAYRNGELVLVRYKNYDAYALTADVGQGVTSITLTSTVGLAVGNILQIYNKNQTTSRATDVVRILTLPGAGVVTFTSIRVGLTGLSSAYAAVDAQIYRGEAAWSDCFLEAAPDIGPAEEGTFGNFRKTIPFSFITNGDRY